jgi:hypothetical protein
MKPTDDKDKADLVLPNLTIKIVRSGESLKLKAGKYTLELKEVPNKSQTYPLLLLDTFITQVTTLLLKEQVDRQTTLQELRESIIGKELKEGKK